jgi:dipeptidyl aminopeptidase/acylaminoacyl peptidase
MPHYDLCLTWNWEYDADFVRLLETACRAHGLSLLQVTEDKLATVLSGLDNGEITFGAFLDRASEVDARFLPIEAWAFTQDAYRINPREASLWSEDKATMHLEFITHGLYTPHTLILPPYAEKPKIPLPDLCSLGGSFVTKPARGGGGEGVVLEASSLEQLLAARQQYPDEKYLLQAHVTTQRLGSRPAWFRVLYCTGLVYPCWWDPDSHVYTPVSPAEETGFGLSTLREITVRIADICKLSIFSTEIAYTPEGLFLVVDYVNDQIDLRLQSKAADGVPDEIVQAVVEGLVELDVHYAQTSNRTNFGGTMTVRKIAPYGSWKSPITTEMIISKFVGLGHIALDGEDIYGVEQRPMEGGRYVVVRYSPDREPADCTPAGFNARTTVHEYGGGFAVADGVIYFSNFADQHLYKQRPGGEPQLLTPGEKLRYADAIIDRRRDHLICVREDHSGPGEAVNALVSVSLAGGDNGQVLVSGNNFYSSPRLSPDGAQLAWLAWDHPNMPWDGSELWIARFREDGTLGERKQVAGGKNESIFQPEWSPDAVLHFVSDRTGWWNLYRWQDNKIEALCPMDAEFGEPQWGFGMSMYAFASSRQMLCIYSQNGISHLARLDTTMKELTAIETPYTELDGIQAGAGKAVFEAGSPTEPPAVVQMDLASGRLEVLRRAFEVTVDRGYFSIPQPVEFPTEKGLSAHGIFYPPQNRDFTAPVGEPPQFGGERPPLMVMSHGGPTAASSTTIRYGIQYWTSRGFAVLDVNYGGSSGYGRAYRERLNGNWGVVDVDDCANGARYLVEKGLVDGNRLVIRGGSAGGYTTLAALTFRDTFKAGASHFGIADLEVFAGDTHKFESRYLETLVGPYPERKDLFIARSPIHFTDRLSTPLILLQGAEDKVVPPNQAEMMFTAVKAKGLPVAYLLFDGEQHGFRKAENIKRAFEAELYFYSKVFGFDLADPIEPVKIENL